MIIEKGWGGGKNINYLDNIHSGCDYENMLRDHENMLRDHENMLRDHENVLRDHDMYIESPKFRFPFFFPSLYDN